LIKNPRSGKAQEKRLFFEISDNFSENITSRKIGGGKNREGEWGEKKGGGGNAKAIIITTTAKKKLQSETKNLKSCRIRDRNGTATYR